MIFFIYLFFRRSEIHLNLMEVIQIEGKIYFLRLNPFARKKLLQCL